MNKYSNLNLHELKYLLKNTIDKKDSDEIKNIIDKIILNSHKKWNINDLILENNPEEDDVKEDDVKEYNYKTKEYNKEWQISGRTIKKEANDKIFTRMIQSSITDNYNYDIINKPYKENNKKILGKRKYIIFP